MTATNPVGPRVRRHLNLAIQAATDDDPEVWPTFDDHLSQLGEADRDISIAVLEELLESLESMRGAS
jgi:hypothetical protein